MTTDVDNKIGQSLRKALLLGAYETETARATRKPESNDIIGPEIIVLHVWHVLNVRHAFWYILLPHSAKQQVEG